jgi:GAF domain-containing protein
VTIIGEGPSSARLDEEALASTARLALAEPWATTRQTPLSHSLCQRVVTSGSPLVLPDARLDERTGTSLAIDDLAVVAYAGMPLTDGEGNVLGSLCAIDRRPRVWSRQELADRADLAAACCGELRLRIMSQLARQARAQVAVALQRSQLMLRAAEDLANTAGLVEVRRSVRNLVVSGLTPSYVGLILLEGQQLRRVPDPEIAYVAEIHSPVFPLDSSRPSARAVRDGRCPGPGAPWAPWSSAGRARTRST